MHPKGRIDFNNDIVERPKRAHLNAMENVYPFFFLGGLYLTTGPQPVIAINLFRAFTAARFLHSLVYIYEVYGI